MLIIFTAVAAAIYNITFRKGEDTNMWISLLSSSIGYILPNPRIKNFDEKKI